MSLMEVETVLPFPIEEVFALTVELERAPHWHSIFTDVRRLTAGPVGVGSRWRIKHLGGSFELEITEFRPPAQVTFRGTAVLGGTVPNFTIRLESADGGTRLRYMIHPEIPALLRPLIKVVAPPYGRRDLARYFRELEKMLASQGGRSEGDRTADRVFTH